jgi:hypothetical protein
MSNALKQQIELEEKVNDTTNKYLYAQIRFLDKLIELGLTEDQIRTSDTFEQLILQHAKKSENLGTLPNVKPQDCSFVFNTIPLANFAVINYKTLSEEQLQKICEFYRDVYNMECFTLNEFQKTKSDMFGCYMMGKFHGMHFDNAICLDLTTLSSKIFPDLKPILQQMDSF